MKVVLTAINAKYIHANPAIYSLAAYAGMYKNNLILKEYTINQYTDDIFKDLYREKADVVAFSCYIWNIRAVMEVADLLKKAMPHIQIWLGGPEVSYDSDVLLKENNQFDGIMRGEGEGIFKEMMAYWVDGKSSLADIRGITWKKDGMIYENAPALPLDMNTLPFIYEDLSLFEHRIIYYESSRGCPYMCSYCLSSIDKHVRFKDAELVKKELQILMDAKVPQVKFVDRTFNCRHSHTMEIWKYIHEHDNGITNFHFEITADLLNDEELDLLASMRPGLVQLEIGVQSTNEQTIQEIRRKVDFNKLSYVVNRIHQGNNIHQHLDLIAGLPYENFERFKESFNDVYLLRPQQLQLGFLKVLKGSYMHEQKDAYELVYRTQPMYEVIATKWMSFDELLYLKDVENVLEIFYNSHQFEKAMAYLEHFFETPFALYEALGVWFRKHNLHEASCQRGARYSQLLDFSKEYVENTALMIELLTYDVYARENIKTRPAWANSQDPYKDEIAVKYSDHEFIEKYLPAHQSESYRTIRHFTHMELFEYDLLAAQMKGQAVKKKQWILFDYDDRNPLTYEARVEAVND